MGGYKQVLGLGFRFHGLRFPAAVTLSQVFSIVFLLGGGGALNPTS